ncbi:hypothetical protein UFOVP142_2 [uncultured Caudovirales phage]|uniref:Uncharacterized protein n=1 Tax=uncultured Caudovirales phage TaxID=2100421 RepID=A0A6J7XMD6_9CAUD|nr:hypothetical protein UFOVP142_2 [uncultured Caudovirales phage]
MLMESYEYNGLTIEIHHDPDSESPRQWGCYESTMHSLNKRYGPFEDGVCVEFKEQMECMADWAVKLRGIRPDEIPFKHIMRIVNKHYICLPYTRMHDGETFAGDSIVSADDDGADGVIFIKRTEALKAFSSFENAVAALKAEVEEYGQWASGNVYGYIVKDEEGEEVDSCWGFYGHVKEKAESSVEQLAAK